MVRFLPIPICVLFLSSCANQNTVPAAEAATATVVKRDGTTAQGKVIESTPAYIRIEGADKVAQTIAMKDVSRVEYGEAAPLAAVGSPAPSGGTSPAPKTAAPVPTPSAPAATAPAPGATPAAAAPPPVPGERVRPTAAAITTKTFRLPVGTEIEVRNEETIDSGKAAEGQLFAAEVTQDVKDDAGDVVIPRGANAQIVIRSASKGGKIRGASDLVLDLAAVSIEGKQYRLSTADLAQKGREGVGINKRTGTFAGGGAAVGAIIGAIAGGGKGAAIGAGSGAGAGAVAQILTKGGAIKVPVETKLTFQLDKPLRVTTEVN